MSAQEQMRAMLDELMGTSRDGRLMINWIIESTKSLKYVKVDTTSILSRNISNIMLALFKMSFMYYQCEIDLLSTVSYSTNLLLGVGKNTFPNEEVFVCVLDLCVVKGDNQDNKKSRYIEFCNLNIVITN